MLIPAGILLLQAGRPPSRPKHTGIALIGIIMTTTGWMMRGNTILQLEPIWLQTILRIIWIVLRLAAAIAMAEKKLRPEEESVP